MSSPIISGENRKRRRKRMLKTIISLILAGSVVNYLGCSYGALLIGVVLFFLVATMENSIGGKTAIAIMAGYICLQFLIIFLPLFLTNGGI